MSSLPSRLREYAAEKTWPDEIALLTEAAVALERQEAALADARRLLQGWVLREFGAGAGCNR